MNHNLGNSFKISIYEDDVHRQLLKEHTITSLTEKISYKSVARKKINYYIFFYFFRWLL